MSSENNDTDGTTASNGPHKDIQLATVQPPRPNARTYWVTDMLLAGEHPTSDNELETRQKLREYLHCGITCFVNLTQAWEKPDYEPLLREIAAERGAGEISVHRLAIPDFAVPRKPLQMKVILDTLDAAIANQQKVYVHCRGGIRRTGTAVGCYLVRHGYTGPEALEQVNRLFQHSEQGHENDSSPETLEQINYVREWRE